VNLIGNAGRRGVGSAAADRQRYGQGAGAGVPVAEYAGRGCARDAGRPGSGQGCRAVLRQPGSAAHNTAPDIVEAILDGRQPAEMQLGDLLNGFPLEWVGQRSQFR
jgi:hypothetical protein